MYRYPDFANRSKEEPSFTTRFPLIRAGLLLMMTCVPQIAFTAERNWINPEDGSWDVPGNWSDAALPTSSDTAIIDNGGTATIGSGVEATTSYFHVGNLNEGALNITGGTLTSFLSYLGTEAGASGTANVSSGTWNTRGLNVGEAGSGRLNITGGTINNSNHGTIAYGSSSTGIANVAGGTWNHSGALSVGNFGDGIMNITGGTVTNSIGYIAGGSGSTGIVNVSNGIWDNSTDLIVGDRGSGTLNITGGTVTNKSAVIGRNTTSSGTVTVSGGTWHNSGLMYIGSRADSTLNITGGRVTSPQSIIATRGNSTVNVSGGVWNNSGNLFIGHAGNGTFNITDSGIATFRNVVLALSSLSNSVLNIGTGGTAGTFEAVEVSGGNGVATLNFNHTNTVSFDSMLSGSLSVNKMGAGTTILTGESNYTGVTQIDAGTLLVNGSLGNTAVSVAPGAILGGNGNIAGSVDVQGGGVLSPGNSTGIMTVGSLALASDSTTVMELNGTVPGSEHDQIIVTGNATLDGTLQLIYGYSPMNGDTFTLIDADSITGDFASVINPLENAMAFDLQITDDYVFKVIAVQTNFTNFVGSDPDLIRVAQVFDDNFSDPGLLPIIDSLNLLPGDDLEAAFEQINPDELTALSGMTFANSRNASYRLGNRLREVRDGVTGFSTSGFNLYDESGRHIRQSLVAASEPSAGIQSQPLGDADSSSLSYFISGHATVGDVEGDSEGPGYEDDSFGVLLGADYRVASNLSLGLYGGFDHSNGDFGGDGGDAEVDSYRLGLQGTWWVPLAEGQSDATRHFFTEAYLGGAYHEFDIERNSFGGTAIGTTDGTELDAGLAVGYQVEYADWIFTTKFNLDYARLWFEGYRESGGLAPLEIEDSESDSLYSTLSFRADYKHRFGDVELRPYAQLGARHQYLDNSESVTARFPGGAAQSFTVDGAKASRDSLIGALGLTALLREGLTAQVGYYAEHNTDIDVHSINASVNLAF